MEKKYVELSHSFTDMWSEDPDKETVLSFRFCKPTKADMARFQSSGAKNGSNASRELLLSLVHEEDKERLLEALEEYPGILITFVNPILSAAGVSAELGK